MSFLSICVAPQKPPGSAQQDLDGDRELTWNDDEAMGFEGDIGVSGMLGPGYEIVLSGAMVPASNPMRFSSDEYTSS